MNNLPLNSNSLKDLLIGANDPRKRKLANAKTEELVESILKLQGSIQLKSKRIRRVENRKKLSKKKSLWDRSVEPIGLNRAKLVKLTTNNVYEYASILGVDRYAIDCLERKFLVSRSLIETFISKFMLGYEHLNGTSSQLLTNDDALLLLSMQGFDISSDIFHLNDIELPIVNDYDISNPDEDNPVIAVDNHGTNNEENNEKQILLTNSNNAIVNYNRFLIYLEAYIRNRSFILQLAELNGWVGKNAVDNMLKNNVETLNNTSMLFDNSEDISNDIDEIDNNFNQTSMFMSSANTFHSNDMNSLFHETASSSCASTKILSTQEKFNNLPKTLSQSATANGLLTINKDLPPLKLKNMHQKQQEKLAINKKQLMKAGFDGSFSRATPRVLQSSTVPSMQKLLQSGATVTRNEIEELRWELTVAREGVKQLDKMVNTNIAWVQSNCEISSSVSSNFSSRTKQKCKAMATERIANVYIDLIHRTIWWGLNRWKNFSKYCQLDKIAKKYSKLKSLEILAKVLYDVVTKQLLKGWKAWLTVVHEQIFKERTDAVMKIQCMVRRKLARRKVDNIRLSKSAVVVQTLFRRVHAIDVVKSKKLSLEEQKRIEEELARKKKEEDDEVALKNQKLQQTTMSRSRYADKFSDEDLSNHSNVTKNQDNDCSSNMIKEDALIEEDNTSNDQSYFGGDLEAFAKKVISPGKDKSKPVSKEAFNPSSSKPPLISKTKDLKRQNATSGVVNGKNTTTLSNRRSKTPPPASHKINKKNKISSQSRNETDKPNSTSIEESSPNSPINISTQDINELSKERPDSKERPSSRERPNSKEKMNGIARSTSKESIQNYNDKANYMHQKLHIESNRDLIQDHETTLDEESSIIHACTKDSNRSRDKKLRASLEGIESHSDLTNDATAKIQKIARGKLARNKSMRIKSEKTISTKVLNDKKISNVTASADDATAKIQKIARGKLARNKSMRIKSEKVMKNVNVLSPMEDETRVNNFEETSNIQGSNEFETPALLPSPRDEVQSESFPIENGNDHKRQNLFEPSVEDGMTSIMNDSMLEYSNSTINSTRPVSIHANNQSSINNSLQLSNSPSIKPVTSPSIGNLFGLSFSMRSPSPSRERPTTASSILSSFSNLFTGFMSRTNSRSSTPQPRQVLPEEVSPIKIEEPKPLTIVEDSLEVENEIQEIHENNPDQSDDKNIHNQSDHENILDQSDEGSVEASNQPITSQSFNSPLSIKKTERSTTPKTFDKETVASANRRRESIRTSRKSFENLVEENFQENGISTFMNNDDNESTIIQKDEHDSLEPNREIEAIHNEVAVEHDQKQSKRKAPITPPHAIDKSISHTHENDKKDKSLNNRKKNNSQQSQNHIVKDTDTDKKKAQVHKASAHKPNSKDSHNSSAASLSKQSKEKHPVVPKNQQSIPNNKSSILSANNTESVNKDLNVKETVDNNIESPIKDNVVKDDIISDTNKNDENADSMDILESKDDQEVIQNSIENEFITNNEIVIDDNTSINDEKLELRNLNEIIDISEESPVLIDEQVIEPGIDDISFRSIERNNAILKIQNQIRISLSKMKVVRKRNDIISSQRKVGLYIISAVNTIQRYERGKQGRKRFKTVYDHNINLQKQKEQNKSTSIKKNINKTTTSMKSQKSFKTNNSPNKSISSTSSKKQNQLKDSNMIDNEENVDNEDSIDTSSKQQRPITAGDKVIEEIEEKIKRLEEIEKNIQEKEQKMLAAAKIAEERAEAMERAFLLMQETQKKNDADRLAREALMEMAAGPINSHRSDYASPYGTRTNNLASNVPQHSVRNTARNSARGNNVSMNGINNNIPMSGRTRSLQNTARGGGNTTSRSAQPSARSARGGAGIPSDAPHMVYNGQDWYELWDPEESSHYWYCVNTFESQWERPGEQKSPTGLSTVVPYYNQNFPDDESGYESAGAMTDYSTDYNEEHSNYGTDSEYGGEGGNKWHEYWDEQAQAKYWYNNETGEASWTLPENYNSDNQSYQSDTGVLTIANSENPSANEWVSYIDEDTAQAYWYNIRTGETNWA